jgi:ferredoxin
MKMRVNPIVCVGHGICAQLFPEFIELDEWGYPIIKTESIPLTLQTHAKRAVAACPTSALLLEND